MNVFQKKRLKGLKVTANCIHPGVVASNFGQTSYPFLRMLIKLASPFLLSTEKAAEGLVRLAVASDVAETTGAYFELGNQKTPSPHATDKDNCRRLWEVSREMVALQDDVGL